MNGLINNNLQKINDQLYKSWFIDFEFPDENGQPYKSSKGKMVNSEFGDIPENWKIGHVDDKILTRIIKSGVSKFLGTKKYIATGNVAENIITGFELVEYKNKPSRANMTPISNSVWLAKMQNSVKNILVDEYMYEILNECIFSTGFMGIECLEDSLYYFWSLINSEDFIDKKNNLSTGTLMAGINNTTIVNYKYLIPDKKVLKKFNIKARSINQIIYNNIVESNKLTQIRNTLLPKLMNGKINLDKIEN